jgi:hypothetical protein
MGGFQAPALLAPGHQFWVETLRLAVSPSSSARNFATPTRIRMIPHVMRVTCTSLTETKHARSTASRPGSGDSRAVTM